MVTNVLEVSGLRKEFGGLVAVSDVSFSVGEGEFVGLNRTKRMWKVHHLQLYQRSPEEDIG